MDDVRPLTMISQNLKGQPRQGRVIPLNFFVLDDRAQETKGLLVRPFEALPQVREPFILVSIPEIGIHDLGEALAAEFC